MKVSLFGLGYVGCVSAACFARAGHHVVGVDVNPTKVDLLNGGQSPIVEKDVGTLLREAIAHGRLRATLDPGDAVLDSEISVICVGTPSRADGSLDLDHVFGVVAQIGAALARKNDYHVVVIRSTVMPGTAARVTALLEKHSGKSAGVGFGVVVNPEFLREGSAVADFLNPPFTMLGSEDAAALDRVAGLYQGIEAPIFRVETRVA